MDYKKTLNLPKTKFPMKANLAQREPQRLAEWEQTRLYDEIRNLSTGRSRFILHDGPPYANGHLHIGHGLNKTIKALPSIEGWQGPLLLSEAGWRVWTTWGLLTWGLPAKRSPGGSLRRSRRLESVPGLSGVAQRAKKGHLKPTFTRSRP